MASRKSYCRSAQFLANSLFTDEMQFKRKDIVHFHNTQIWANKNVSHHRHWRYQHPFSINICVIFFGNELLKIICLTQQPNRCRVLSVSVQPFTSTTGRTAYPPTTPVGSARWSTAHFLRIFRKHLNQAFGSEWIGHGGSVKWPTRHLELTSGYFHYFWISGCGVMWRLWYIQSRSVTWRYCSKERVLLGSSE